MITLEVVYPNGKNYHIIMIFELKTFVMIYNE